MDKRTIFDLGLSTVFFHRAAEVERDKLDLLDMWCLYYFDTGIVLDFGVGPFIFSWNCYGNAGI